MKYKRYIIVLFLFVSGLSKLGYCYTEDIKLETSLELSISVVCDEVKIGTQPRFLLKIMNNNNKGIKILNLETRKDLIDSKVNIVISYLEKDVPFHIDISDPGRITEKDYITLPSKEYITFSIDSYYKNFKFPESGQYKIKAEFYNFPYFVIKSKSVSFYVK